MLILIAGVLVFTQCADDFDMENNDTSQTPIDLSPVEPEPATACGVNVQAFALNSFQFDGKCFRLKNSFIQITQQNWFFVLTQNLRGGSNVNEFNYMEIRLFFKEKPVTSNTEYTTRPYGTGLKNDEVSIAVIDGRNFVSSKSQIIYYSDNNQKVEVQATGAGIFVKFQNINFYNESGRRIIIGSGYVFSSE